MLLRCFICYVLDKTCNARQLQLNRENDKLKYKKMDHCSQSSTVYCIATAAIISSSSAAIPQDELMIATVAIDDRK